MYYCDVFVINAARLYPFYFPRAVKLFRKRLNNQLGHIHSIVLLSLSLARSFSVCLTHTHTNSVSVLCLYVGRNFGCREWKRLYV